MEKLVIFGHKSPDTDTICAALVLEDLEKKLGKEAKAYRQGEVNKETEYALNYFGVEEPELLKSLEDGKEVALVDHNEFSQSADNIENAKIRMVIDHHRIDNFRTNEPLYYRAEPVGCTCTILYKMYNEKGINIDKNIAGLMLSAIISDTLLLKSPTTTDEDRVAVEELSKIAAVDFQKYGLDMLKAGTDLSSFSADELISLDAKLFEIDGKKVKVAQVNTADIDEAMQRKDEIKKAIEKAIDAQELDLFMLAITDIINSNSEAIVIGNSTYLFEDNFGKKLEDDAAFLPGVVSRKKQMIPVLQGNK